MWGWFDYTKEFVESGPHQSFYNEYFCLVLRAIGEW